MGAFSSRARLMTAALVVSVSALTEPASAWAAGSGPACGDVLVASVRLPRDLVCAGDGLTIAADGVTLDLAGHTIRSSTIPTQQGVGVRLAGPNSANVDRAVVQGGSIAGFADAVKVLGDTGATDGAHQTLRDLRLTHNEWALTTYDRKQIQLDRVVVRDGPNGVRTKRSDIRITRSSIDAPGVVLASDAHAILAVNRSAITGGELDMLDTRFDVTNSTFLHVGSRCRDSIYQVTHSRFVNSPLSTFRCEGSSFERSSFEGTAGLVGFAIRGLDSPSVPPSIKVTGNIIRGFDTGISVSGTVRDALVADNLLTDNRTGLTASQPDAPGNPHGTVTGNHFVGNHGDGLRLDAGTWTVEGNTAVANAGTGTGISPSVILTDGGHNLARANQGGQCVGITC